MSALDMQSPKVKRAGIVARMLHGTGAGAVAYGLGIGSNLLLLPLYLRYWSVASYGEWMALYSVVNYLANLDFGVTTAAINAATMAYAREDWESFKRVQGTAWATALVIAVFGSVLIVAPSLFYFRVNRWLGMTVIGQHDSRLVFCCLAISLLANIPGRQLISVYTSIGKFATYQWLYNASALISVLVTAIALTMGAGPVELAATTAAATLTMILFMAWFLVRHRSSLMPQIRDADWETARRLAAPTGQFGISMLATALTVQGPIVVLSRSLGGPAVALFATTRTVANVVRGTLALLRAPLRPEFSATSAQPNKDALRRLFRIAVSIDAIIAISLTAILWSGGVWLIRFWSHHRINPDPLLLHLLLIAFMLEGFLQMLTIAGWSSNRFRAASLGQLATAAISLILAIALLDRFGLSAIPLATLAPLIAVMTPLSVRNAQSEAHVTLRYVVGRLLFPFAFLIAICAALPPLVASLSISPAWISDGLSTLAICILAACTIAAVFLTGDDRNVIRDRTTSLLASWMHPTRVQHEG